MSGNLLRDTSCHAMLCIRKQQDIIWSYPTRSVWSHLSRWALIVQCLYFLPIYLLQTAHCTAPCKLIQRRAHYSDRHCHQAWLPPLLCSISDVNIKIFPHNRSQCPVLSIPSRHTVRCIQLMLTHTKRKLSQLWLQSIYIHLCTYICEA